MPPFRKSFCNPTIDDLQRHHERIIGCPLSDEKAQALHKTITAFVRGSVELPRGNCRWHLTAGDITVTLKPH